MSVIELNWTSIYVRSSEGIGDVFSRDSERCRVTAARRRQCSVVLLRGTIITTANDTMTQLEGNVQSEFRRLAIVFYAHSQSTRFSCLLCPSWGTISFYIWYILCNSDRTWAEERCGGAWHESSRRTKIVSDIMRTLLG